MKTIVILLITLTYAFSWDTTLADTNIYTEDTLSLNDNLYCNSDPVAPKKESLLMIVAVQKAVEANFVYTSSPPQYPAEWVYKYYQIESLEEVDNYKDQHVVAVIEVGKVYSLKKIFKTVKSEVESTVVAGIKIKETE